MPDRHDFAAPSSSLGCPRVNHHGLVGGSSFNAEAYFCDPRSPWQRASNENTNPLLRQYRHPGTDLPLHSQARLSGIAHQLNPCPIKTSLYRKPAKAFRAVAANETPKADSPDVRYGSGADGRLKAEC